MKNAGTIIESIIGKRQYRPLSAYGCYGKFMHSLPPSLKRAISFLFIKDKALFLALSHPGYKMELNYNKDVIKSLLRVFVDINPQCEFMRVSKIVVFESKYSIVQDSEQIEDTIPRYSEMATGDFEVTIENEEIRRYFEKTREDIIKNRDR